MNYRGIEYSVVQGFRRNLWKWSASVANVVITGQSHSKSDAVVEAERRLIGRSLRKRCGLSRCLDAGIVARQTAARATSRATLATQPKLGPTLRSRDHLDPGYQLSLYRLVLDGGVSAQQSEAETAVQKRRLSTSGFLLLAP
jgi:hypothetical protein